MSEEIFTKSGSSFRIPPNLPDIKAAGEGFSYDELAKTELEFFPDGKLNAAYNAVDRHLKTHKKDTMALLWEGANGEKKSFTFADIAFLSNQFGNLLKKKGVIKGDRVFIFLPRVPHLYTAFLGILKIGAIAGTLFSAFQEQALFDRISDSGAKILITNTDLASRLEKIKAKLYNLKHIICVDDPSFQAELDAASPALEIEHMDKDDYAFMLYTSGTTGRPKGVVHRHYAILSQHLTAKYVLDLHEEDIYWCTADPGWVTGIAYEILGSWSNGATEVVHEGRFDPAKWYEILQTYKVTVWYTAPTAVRMLMAAGDELVKKYDLSHLRHILSVGEPLNPEALRWGIRAFGLPFHDTWWQTETGAMAIVNYIAMDIKIGSMGKPFLGLTAAIVDDNGNEVPVKTEGNIALRPGWPSMMVAIWQNEKKFQSYFTNGWPASNASRSDAGWYISGDHGWQDEDGYLWFIGRADDVIKTSGERVGPFEVESALVEHPSVVEAGVIGKPDSIKGEIIKAFVVLKKDVIPTDALKEELSQFVKKHLAGHAYPREIEFIDKLPKTRSGKIMRRILKAKELGLPIGDTSTLEEF